MSAKQSIETHKVAQLQLKIFRYHMFVLSYQVESTKYEKFYKNGTHL